MSGEMTMFFANLLPWVAFLWALNLVLFYKTIYEQYFNDSDEIRIIVPLIAISITSLFILLPIRTIINKCVMKKLEEEEVVGKEPTYIDYYPDFITDYERENPVTKNEGMDKWLAKKIDMEKDDVKKK